MDSHQLTSLKKIRVLLLENIADSATNEFNKWGIENIDKFNQAFSEQELLAKIHHYHVIGIRSGTTITKKVLQSLDKFSTIGCFCIGTNQVDLMSAKYKGIPVFNAPYSNTRSVAELAICLIIALFRKIGLKNLEMHAGIWNKSAINCYEIREKKLGIIGYGHIGKQLGLLAESLGMNVIYYDIINQLSLGNAKACKSMSELLQSSDIVSLHVPEDEDTTNLINKATLEQMKKGSYLLNLARGSTVNIDDLSASLKSGHIAGAAFDVYPVEPNSKNEEFISQLRSFNNVILTPHIAGSSVEAQTNIGREVASSICQFISSGNTIGAVNFVNLSIPKLNNITRFIHIHINEFGKLAAINSVFNKSKLNILGQYLQTDKDIGYAVIDAKFIADDERRQVLSELRKIDNTLRSYSIY